MPARFATFEVLVPEAHEDDASVLLWELGTVGVQVEPRPDGRVALTASFRESAALEGALRGALAHLPAAAVRPVQLPEVDWVARFREDFRAFEASGFTIAPEWDGRGPAADTILVEPGRAFGTGTHQTTRLCLELLAEEATRRPLGRVLDVGAGTGLLAIAALRLGARASAAVDLDEDATASCMRHARLNDMALGVVQGDGGRAFAHGRFDLVLANLMAPLLIERAAELRALCAPGATLILSGLLLEDVEAVSRAYAFGAVERRLDGEWAALRVRLP